MSAQNALDLCRGAVATSNPDNFGGGVVYYLRVEKIRIFADQRKFILSGELYDLVEDPGELDNLWNKASHAGVKARLVDALMREMLDNVDQSPRARRRA